MCYLELYFQSISSDIKKMFSIFVASIFIYNVVFVRSTVIFTDLATSGYGGVAAMIW